MNTLGYVARQFDVLASTKTASTTTAPSTPTNEDRQLTRVKTWSFLFPHPHVSPRRSRSFASLSPSPPSFSQTLSPPQPPSPSQPPSLSQAPSLFHPPQPPSSSQSTPPHLPPSPPDQRSKPHIEIVIDSIFFIRVFLLTWDKLKAAWSSLVHHLRLLTPGTDLQKGSDHTRLQSSSDLTLLSALIKSEFSSRTPPQQLSPSASPALVSRSDTPVLHAKKTPFHLPKTLVLDLDETLIHSTSRPMPLHAAGGSGLLALGSFGRGNKGAGHMVEVVMAGRSTLYHVYKRPFVDFFLRTVSGWYTLVIFTASMQEYADPVIDWLDAGRGILAHRFFRDSCTQLPNGSYTKDLSLVETDLSRVCLVDNSPVSYTVNEANGIPIEGWTHDPSDEALLDLLPVLDSLRFTSDVRRVLGLRSAGVHHHS